MSVSDGEEEESDELKDFVDLRGKSPSLTDSRFYREVELVKAIVPVEKVVARGRPCSDVALEAQLRVRTRFGYATLTRLPTAWHAEGIFPDELCRGCNPEEVEWGVDIRGMEVKPDSHPNFGSYHVGVVVKMPGALQELLARVARE